MQEKLQSGNLIGRVQLGQKEILGHDLLLSRWIVTACTGVTKDLYEHGCYRICIYF
jgi:hypothetical protein